MEPSLLARARRGAIRTLLAAPAPILRGLAGGAVVREGKTLDPQLAAALAMARRVGVATPETLPVPEARAHAARTLAAFDAAPRPMAQVIDTAAPGPAGPVPVRVYRPHRAARAMIVYFHGGGGVIGSIASSDPLCRLLADETRCLVASVEYRLAPEHPHPAGVEDALAAWRWARGAAPALGVDPARLAVAGDSMGGYLAVMVERRDRSAPRPAAAALIYPAVDLTRSLPSHQTFADGFLLTRAMLDWFVGHFCPDPAVQRRDSPLFWDDVAGAPPTWVVTAGFDPLLDEGRRWADRLAGAGARVVYQPNDALVHGFASMTGAFPAARAAVRALTDDLRAHLAG